MKLDKLAISDTLYVDYLRVKVYYTTGGGGTATYYNHPDHLTGSNVVSNEQGSVEQLLDYYPFGGIRLDEKIGSFDEQRKFTGQEFDEDTNLHYYVQRYYNQDVGRFTSQDPVFLAIGTGDKRAKVALTNPQSLNSYSYVVNSPLKYVDEEGEWFGEFLTGRQSWSDFKVEVGQATERLTQNSKVWNYAVENPAEAGAVTGLVGGAAFLTGVPAVAAYSSSIVPLSGVGKVIAVNRLIEGSFYTYLTADALADLPNKLQKALEVQQGDLKSYANFAGGFALDYGPGAFGETAGAIGDLVQFTQSITSQLVKPFQQQKDQTDNKDKKE